MIPRKYRLAGKKNIELVKQKGQLFQSENFALLVLKRSEENLSQMGLVVSKKVARKASERNKIKRMIRLTLCQFVLQLKKGYALVLLAKPKIAGLKTRDLVAEIKPVFKKAGIIE